MRTFSTSVDIAAPPAAVWTVWQDVERWPEWTASMSALTVVSGTPLDVGARVRVEQPRLSPVVMTVTEAVPGERFAWAADRAGLHTVADHRMRPAPGGTGVRVTLSVAFSGLLSPFVGRAFGQLAQRYVEMEAAGLKRRAEALMP